MSDRDRRKWERGGNSMSDRDRRKWERGGNSMRDRDRRKWERWGNSMSDRDRRKWERWGNSMSDRDRRKWERVGRQRNETCLKWQQKYEKVRILATSSSAVTELRKKTLKNSDKKHMENVVFIKWLLPDAWIWIWLLNILIFPIYHS